MFKPWTVRCVPWLVLAGTTVARADYLPSFFLDTCAWKATDIVVVSEGEAIDGVMKVVETWSGGCRPGDVLTIPELAAFAPAATRVISSFWLHPGAKPEGPASVTGERIVLFLCRSPVPASQPAGSTPRWLPAGMDMSVSCAWIQEGRSYAMVQEVNPGPALLVSIRFSESELQAQVAEYTQARAAFDRAVAQKDAWERAAALYALAMAYNVPYGKLDTDSRWRRLRVQGHVIDALGDCHEAALPWLARLWREPSFSGLYWNVTRAVGRCAEENAGRMYTGLLFEEVQFWRTAVPKLAGNWLSHAGGPQDERARQLAARAECLARLLNAMVEDHTPDCRELVTEARDLVLAMPESSPGDRLRPDCLWDCDLILARVP